MPVLPPDDPNEWFAGADITLTLWPRKARGRLGDERDGPVLLNSCGVLGTSCAAFSCTRDICETGQV